MAETVFRVRISAPLALWTNPHYKSDPHTYPVPTHGGLWGLLKNIYKKPEFEIEVLRVRVLAPIQYLTQGFRALTNQRDRHATTLQTVTMLQNVDYLAEFRIKLNPLRTTLDQYPKYVGEMARRLSGNKQFSETYCGRRELAAKWVFVENNPPQALPLNMDLGMMFFDFLPLDIKTDSWEPLFFHARLVDGTLTFPEELHLRRREPLFVQRNKVHPNRTSLE